MYESILTGTKKNLGIDTAYTAFDPDIIMHINSVFSILNGIGLGPAEGFMIDDDTAEWAEFMGTDNRLNSVKTYVYLRVRMLFDPPTTSYMITALEAQYKEIEWRLSIQRESVAWVDPDPPVLVDDLYDGGNINSSGDTYDGGMP
jgi:hypothetical protein